MVARRSSHGTLFAGAGLALLLAVAVPPPLHAGVPAEQTASAGSRTLRDRIEERYEVLPLQNGIALKPRSRGGVRSIEISDGTIAIDGTAVTGGELRARLGSEADTILRLSYLDPAARRALFEFGAPPVEAPAVTVEAPAVTPESAAPEQAAPAPQRRPVRRSGAQVRIGGSVTVGPDEIVTDDVVVIGGTANIDGEVNGDVVVVGGVATLGPHADVHRDVTVVGGVLTRDPDARVGGRVNEIGVGPIVFDMRNLRRGVSFGPFRRFNALAPFGSLLSTVFRFVLLSLLACAIVLAARATVERIGDRAAVEPLKAGLVGFLIELLIAPVLIFGVIVLIISIVGIPLLVLVPFVVLAVLVVFLAGFTGVAYRLGRRLEDRLGWGADPYVAAILGIAIILSPVLVARVVGLAGGVFGFLALTLVAIGFLVEYVAWTVGFGAAALARFSSRVSSSGGAVIAGAPPPQPVA